MRVVHGQTDRIATRHRRARLARLGDDRRRTHAAALKMRAQGAGDGGVDLLQAPPEELDIADGVVVIAIGRRARRSHSATSRAIWRRFPSARRRDPGLTAEGWFRADAHDLSLWGPYRAWCASTATPGAVEVERYLVAYDIGRAVNPMLVEGQLVGGFAQGLGGALWEEFAMTSAASRCR